MSKEWRIEREIAGYRVAFVGVGGHASCGNCTIPFDSDATSDIETAICGQCKNTPDGFLVESIEKIKTSAPATAGFPCGSLGEEI